MYKQKYFKKKNKVSYKINSIKEDNMVGTILIMGGTVVALHNNWSDTKKYKWGER